MKKAVLSALVLLSALSLNAKTWTPKDILDIIYKVNNTWQQTHPRHERAFWDPAVYHTGNMEAYQLLKNQAWYDYSKAWAEHNEWMGAKEPDATKWEYKQYGEGQQYVLFGDWQICFQTYIDLYMLRQEGASQGGCCTREKGKDHGECAPVAPDENYKMIKRALEVMRHEAHSDANDYWWWADALYMVMPVMTKMYLLTGDRAYLDKMYDNWQYANSIMYDAETGLYFRDGKYVYPRHQTASGRKDFWARGDGWVVAAFAKVLKDLPKDDQHRKTYLKYYKKMVKAVADCQQPEGYWTRSMLDAGQAPGRETSGTALFAYGIQWGINNGVLPAKRYQPVVDRAFDYLATIALQPDGTVGYVQPIGEKAIPGQVVNQKSVTNFGTGAFLLAACEYYRHVAAAYGTAETKKKHKGSGLFVSVGGNIGNF